MQYYKVARPDGFDFQTGKTINYRENIGKLVVNPKKTTSATICSDEVLHASEIFTDALGYGQIPCSIYLVEGTPVVQRSDKYGFKKLKVLEEIPTDNWQEAYQDWVIWMLGDVKQYIGKNQQVLDAINGVIRVFTKTKTRKVSKEEYEATAWDANWAALTAAEAADWAARATAEAVARKRYSEKFIEILKSHT